MRTLKQTSDVQRDLMREMNIDTMDDMLDEMQEIKIAQEEFTDAIQKNYEVEVDEADLDEGKNIFEFIDFKSRIRATRL